MNKLLLFKFILIIILMVGIYIFWVENKKLKNTSQTLKEKLQNQERYYKKTLNEKLQIQKIYYQKEIKKLKQELQNVKENTHKAIKIVLPEDKKDYSDIIPKLNYDLIPLEKNKNKDNSIKVTPEVILDKEEKNIDGFKINVKTKF